MAKILGLDLGSHHSGAAVLVVGDDGRPVAVQAVEEWASEEKDLDTRLRSFHEWSKSLVQKHDLLTGDILAAEAPFVGIPKTALILGQLLGLVRWLGWWGETDLILVSAKEAKAALTGTGSAYKGEMVAAAKMQFQVEATDHQADAIGIALAAYGKLRERALVRLADRPPEEPTSLSASP